MCGYGKTSGILGLDAETWPGTVRGPRSWHRIASRCGKPALDQVDASRPGERWLVALTGTGSPADAAQPGCDHLSPGDRAAPALACSVLVTAVS